MVTMTGNQTISRMRMQLVSSDLYLVTQMEIENMPHKL